MNDGLKKKGIKNSTPGMPPLSISDSIHRNSSKPCSSPWWGSLNREALRRGHFQVPVLDSPPTVAASAPCWYGYVMSKPASSPKWSSSRGREHAALLALAAVEVAQADGTLGGVVALDAGDGKELAERPRLVPPPPKSRVALPGDQTSRCFLRAFPSRSPALLREAPRSMASTGAHASRSRFTVSR